MKTEEKMLHILEKNCADALESGILVALMCACSPSKESLLQNR